MKKISKATILSIGDEILIGQILNTNSYKIAQWLVEKGIEITQMCTIPDDEGNILSTISSLEYISDIVVVTGGLGPTKDDRTKRAIAKYFDSQIEVHQPTMERLQEYFKKRKKIPSEAILEQAYYPKEAIILPNNLGTAQGILMSKKDILFLFLPGVPHEMEYIIKNSFFKWLAESQYDTGEYYHQTILTAGIGESTIAKQIEDIEESLPSQIKLSYLPQIGGVRMRLTAQNNQNKAKEETKIYMDQIAQRIKGNVMAYKDTTKRAALHELLIKTKLTISCAESCSGGLLSHKLTSISGSSSYFLGSIIAYNNDIKKRVLGVSPQTLEKYGAVSKETVKEMKKGVLTLMGSDLSISISGIAGPTGGSIEKPVGTIWLAIGNATKTKSKLLDFNRNRKLNLEYATEIAIFEIFKFIQDEYVRNH